MKKQKFNFNCLLQVPARLESQLKRSFTGRKNYSARRLRWNAKQARAAHIKRKNGAGAEGKWAGESAENVAHNSTK